MSGRLAAVGVREAFGLAAIGVARNRVGAGAGAPGEPCWCRGRGSGGNVELLGPAPREGSVGAGEGGRKVSLVRASGSAGDRGGGSGGGGCGLATLRRWRGLALIRGEGRLGGAGEVAPEDASGRRESRSNGLAMALTW